MTPFAAIFVPEPYRQTLSDVAWLAAMLDAERALAQAGARAGVVPAEHAAAIAERCQIALLDPALLALEGRAVGNPVEPLVRRLVASVSPEAGAYVHRGATSQDIRWELVDDAAEEQPGRLHPRASMRTVGARTYLCPRRDPRAGTRASDRRVARARQGGDT